MTIVTGKIFLVFTIIGLLSGLSHWYAYSSSITLFTYISNLALIAAGMYIIYGITVNKKKEQCQKDNEDDLDQRIAEPILRSLPVAFLTVNKVGQITNMNQLAGKLCGINTKSVNIHDLTLEEGNPLYQLAENLKGRPTHREGDNSYYQQGDQRYFFCTANISNELGQPVGAVMIAWKSTEGILVEKYLSQKDKMAMMGELAAGIAHEIRNPLTSVKGLVQILIQRFQKDDPAREYAKVILSEIDSINHIIKELLLLARRSSPNLSFAALPALLDHILLLAEGEAACRGIQITKDYDDNLPLVILDEDQMRQVFLNLATNAIHAMPNGGNLTVSVHHNESEEVIETIFKDEGIGISEENISRIFHPFYTTRPEGTGLGLPVSCQIVDNHGGKLSVKSTLGKGSVVVVKLPLINYDKTKAS